MPDPDEIEAFHRALIAREQAARLVVRCEIAAFLDTLEKLAVELSSASGVSATVHEDFAAFRKQAIERALLLLENHDPTFAAEVQRAIDDLGELP